MNEQDNNKKPEYERKSESPLLFSDEVERRVITNILTYNRNFFSAGNLLSPKIFHNQKNAKVFAIIQKGIADGANVDNIYVATYLMHHPDQYGYTASDILTYFSDYVPDVTFGQDVALLREFHKRHELWMLGQNLIRIGIDMAITPDSAIQEITKVIEENDDEGNGVISMKEANEILMKRVDANHNGTSDTFLETGFAVLDESGGFQVGDFDVIAADSSMGKTSLVMNISKNIAGKGKPCMIYSMEMQAWQLAARINAPKANTPANVIQYKDLKEFQYRDLQAAVQETDNLPIYFDDKSTSSADAILASIRLNARKLGIKFFVIDYLQILSAVGMIKDTEKFLGEISRRFKNLAKELNVNITVLSQLARNNQDPRPTLSRVRASGQIVEAADTVLLIWRPEMYGKTSYKDNNAPVYGTAEIIIAKGRNIGTGSFVVHFEPTTTNFTDATPEEREAWSGIHGGKQEETKEPEPLPEPKSPEEQALPF